MNTKMKDWREYAIWDDTKIFGFFGKEDNEYKWLSNFHKCEVLWDGYIWPSSEHAYMVAKTDRDIGLTDSGESIYNDCNISRFAICALSCAQVKRWGQTVRLREDWEQVKSKIMYQVCLDKFTRNEDLKQKLIDTGDKVLIEANSWGDAYYGYDVDNKEGLNMLGEILMKIRGRI